MELSKEKFKIIGCDDQDAEAILRPNITYWQDAWRRLKMNKVAIASLIVIIIMGIMVIVGPYLSGINYEDQNLGYTNMPPSSKYWFGTDELGRDMFSRVWIGGRVSIAIGLVATAIEFIVGCLYGGICGYFGGMTDEIMMRIVEVLCCIPNMIVIILISIVLGSGFGSLIIAISIVSWLGVARVVRGQVMQLKESEYVLAAQALGADSGRIITKHLLPNTIGILIVMITMDIPAFIFAEAWLSFIGLGIQPPDTSWGAMINAGQSQFEFYPHEMWLPAAVLCLTVLAFNLLGDGLAEALDPKLRK